MTNSSQFRAGDRVEVRSKDEILQTLDKNGQLEELPFMPEMFEYCGRQFQVFKRAHKTCDPPNGMRGRRMLHAVHLEGVYCSGSAHGGCQARCLIFWKDAWLKPADSVIEATTASSTPGVPNGRPPHLYSGCREEDVTAGAFRDGHGAATDDPAYICQSTNLRQATQVLHGWDLRQYVEDYTSRNVRFSQLLSAFSFFLYSQIVSAGIGLGTPLRWAYDAVQKVRGGTPYPMRFGKVERGVKAPSARLDVQPGDLVRIRSLEEILETVSRNGMNRGLSFDPEMVPYCGGTYRVLNRITKIIHEKTGKMQYMKNDCIMLEDVVCRACYSKHRRFCPRSIYSYWREIWLERLPDTNSFGGKGKN